MLVQVLESWGLPQPDIVTNEGINSWMNQVIRAYSSGNPAVLSDSCMSMYRNAQLLNAGNMDMMRASLQTYSADCAKLLAFKTKCEAELAKNQQEFGLHMRTCQECSERYNTEKEALRRKMSDLTRSSSGARQLSESAASLNQAHREGNA